MAIGYQLQFLRTLNEHDVKYLVVGGAVRKSRMLQEGYDLDLWLRLRDGDAMRIFQALRAWRSRYGHHFNLLTDDIPVVAGGRYLIPAYDEAVNYEHSSGDWRPVTIKDGVDLIIGVEAFPSFVECFARAVVHELEPGLLVRFLHSEDDARLPNLRGNAFAK